MPQPPALLLSSCQARCPYHQHPCSSTHGGTRPGLFSVHHDLHLCVDRGTLHPFWPG